MESTGRTEPRADGVGTRTVSLKDSRPPEHLSEAGKECYASIIADIPNLKRIHQPEIEMAAEAYSRFVVLSKEKTRLEKEDVIKTYYYRTTNGNYGPSILVRQIDEARDCYIGIMEKLRLASAMPAPHPDMFAPK